MKTMILMTLMAATLCAVADDTLVAKRVTALARKVNIDAYQKSDMGLTGKMHVSKPVRNNSKNKGAPAFNWVQENNFHAVIRHAKGEQARTVVDSTGQHVGVKPSYDRVLNWQGKAWRIGWIKYVNRQGMWNQLPLFTASEAEAIEFYKKHGFTDAAKDAVEVLR